MTIAEGVFHVVLRAYPAAFRTEFEREMTIVFNDRRRAMHGHRLRFWVDVMLDVGRSAPALQLEALNARWSGHTQRSGGKMKTMGILAILVGVLEMINSMIEAYAGGIVRHGGASLVGGSVGAIAGALLVVGAIALLRRSPRAPVMAQGAALACLSVFALVFFVQPMFSIAATMLGIGFPIALLLFFRLTGGRRSSLPRTA